MSGLGKTHLSNLLRQSGSWFHYSVDYRIGTRYLGEHIVDNFKRVAMRQPSPAGTPDDRTRSTSRRTSPSRTSRRSRPGSASRATRARAACRSRSTCAGRTLHREAEIAALLDTVRFIDRAQDLYGYGNFVCDSSGSICEVVDPDDPADPVLSALAAACPAGPHRRHRGACRGTGAPLRPGAEADVLPPRRARSANGPPILEETASTPDEVDPDAFVRWTYRRALARREPIYRAIADKWGVTRHRRGCCARAGRRRRQSS